MRDDEIPLALSKSSVLQETKAKFDSLLRSASIQVDKKHDKVQEKKNKKMKSAMDGPGKIPHSANLKKDRKRSLSTSTQKLIESIELSSNGSEDEADKMAGITSVKTKSSIASSDEVDVDADNVYTKPSNNDKPSGSRNMSPSYKHITAVPSQGRERNNSSIPHMDTPLKLKQALSTSGGELRDIGTIENQKDLKRPVPLPRRKVIAEEMQNQKQNFLTWEGSQDTTSSLVSSGDSVMTAVQALSPEKTTKGTSDSPSRQRKDDTSVEFELKPLKRNSASYEEIDESNLQGPPGLSSERKVKKTSVKTGASYEEITEIEPRRDILANQSIDSENVQESTGKQNKSKFANREEEEKFRARFSSRHKRTRHQEVESETNSDEMPYTVHRRARGRSKRRQASSNIQKEPVDEGDRPIEFNYQELTGIVIHRSDSLKVDSLIRHPMVRVHFIDTLTGGYLKKSNPDRCVSFYYEHGIDYIQPLTTRPCRFKDPRSLTPVWEEILFFNEDFNYILRPDAAIIILFEVLDFVPFDIACAQYRKFGQDGGWHRVAWAYLKPIGSNNVLNVEKRLRLQLFKPRSGRLPLQQSNCDTCDVYQWWHAGSWVQYPSTLYVTMRSIPAPENVPPALRSQLALQPEQGLIEGFNCSDDDQGASRDVDCENSSIIKGGLAGMIQKDGDAVFTWSRLPTQSCKIPNERILNLPSGQKGSFCIQFSHRGQYLAASAANRVVHSVFVYRIPSGKEELQLTGHVGLIYSLDWSIKDDLLLSASADCTACIWNIDSKKTVPMQMLPHPSFVYCAVFVPESENEISLITGCCDHVVRVWSRTEPKNKFQLMQELSGHEGYISALCVDSNKIIYSGDSVGQIQVWHWKNMQSWENNRTINSRELQGVILNQLVLHPGEKRLLVHGRDSILRMLDLKTGVPIQWFKGALNHRIHSGAAITPCGTLVLSASEDGTFYVWNVDTGVQMATYSRLFHGPSKTASKHLLPDGVLSGTVHYHPYDHMAAFAVYGCNTPVVVCSYSRDSTGKDIGLQILTESELNNPGKGHQSIPSVGVISKTALLTSHLRARASHRKSPDFYSHTDYSVESSGNLSRPSHEEQLNTSKNGFKLSSIIKQFDQVLQFSRSPVFTNNNQCHHEKEANLGSSSSITHNEENEQSPVRPIRPVFSKNEDMFAKIALHRSVIDDNELENYSFNDRIRSYPNKTGVVPPKLIKNISEKPIGMVNDVKKEKLIRVTHDSVTDLAVISDSTVLSSDNDSSQKTNFQHDRKPKTSNEWGTSPVSKNDLVSVTTTVQVEHHAMPLSSFDSDSDSQLLEVEVVPNK